MAYELDCDHEVSKFEFLSFFYVHFQTNTFGKDIIPSAMGWIESLQFFYKDCFSIKKIEGWYAIKQRNK